MISDIPSTLLSNVGLEKPLNGNASKPRLSNAARAQGITRLLIEADKERAITLATVKGMLDGNAPFNQAALIANGQANRTNVNFREGEAMLSSAETPYYDLFAESPTYFQIEIENPDPSIRAKHSRIITEAFDEMLKDWAGFDYNMQRIIHEMVGFGRGICMWPDPVNWRFVAIQQSRVLVPDGTLADPDLLEIVVIRQSLTVSELWAKIRNKDAARKVGWDPEAVAAAIGGAVPETEHDSTTYDYEKVQERIRNHDLYESVRSDKILIANILVREFSGKVSHLIVEERNAVESRVAGSPQDEKRGEVKFLYQGLEKYNCFRQAMGTFFFDIGDGTWHSVKGLGVKLYPFIEIKNRLNCSIVDNAFLNLSVLLQPTTGKSEQETALMQLGPMTILPANFEVRQWGIAGRMEEGLYVERALSSKLEGNTGQYRKPLTRDQGNPATATQVNYDAIKEASLNKGAVNRFYAQLDCLGEEMFRRATNLNLTPEPNGVGPNSAALEFQQKCLDAGVPKIAFKQIRYVRASRTSGNGSVFLRQQIIDRTASLVPMMNEAGRQNWLDHAIAITAGSENVAMWNPKQQLDPSLQNDQAFAMLENDAIRNGSPVIVTSTQNALVHATTHMQAAAEAVNSIPQGGDPVHVLAFLDGVGPHVAQHLQSMQGDTTRTKELKALSDQLKQLGAIADKLRAQLEQQQQQQQKQMERQQKMMQQQQERTQQVMTDEQLKAAETESKIKLSQAKAVTAMELRKERHDQDMELKRKKAAMDMAVSDAQAATDIRTKTAKTAADISTKKAKSRS